jgi:RNA polymerase sigma factor (TIGR02999 family)
MTPGSTQSVTGLLQAWASGDQAALDELLPLVYDDLRRQARRYMRAQPAGHTLQTTALVHEAYLRLVGQSAVEWNGRAHFFGVAAKAMRSILVDHARARSAAKRGGSARGGGGPIGSAPASAALGALEYSRHLQVLIRQADQVNEESARKVSQMRWMSSSDSSQFFLPRFLRRSLNH